MVKKVLFICLGNICRSPIAEGVFMHLIEKNAVSSEWEVDSAAIGNWHVGKQPDPRAREVLKENNVKYDRRARQIKKNDFEEFDYIFGMDYENMDDLNRLSTSSSKAKLFLLGDFDPQGEKIIRDPYYDNGSEGFKKCFEQCIRCCTAFLKDHKSM